MGDYHHGDLANALLKSARVVLKEKGLHGLSLRACAMHAGVSHAAPAHHFKSLKGLLTKLAIIAFDEFTLKLKNRLEQVSVEPDLVRLQEVGQAYVDFSSEQPELFALMFSSENIDSENPCLIESSNNAYQQLVGVVWPLFDRKKMSEDKREQAEILVWSIVHGYGHLLANQSDCQQSSLKTLPDVSILGELLS